MPINVDHCSDYPNVRDSGLEVWPVSATTHALLISLSLLYAPLYLEFSPKPTLAGRILHKVCLSAAEDTNLEHGTVPAAHVCRLETFRGPKREALCGTYNSQDKCT